MIKVTQSAINRITDVLKQQKNALGLRIRIAGQTATEYKVQLGLAVKGEETDAKKEDRVVDCKVFKLFVDPESAKKLNGASLDFIQEGKESGFKVDNPNRPEVKDKRVFEVQKFIDENINPMVASHGGVIDLLDVKGDAMYIHMGGGCQGCASSTATLKQGVEKAVFEKFPDIKKIVDTTDHAAGTNPYYKNH